MVHYHGLHELHQKRHLGHGTATEVGALVLRYGLVAHAPDNEDHGPARRDLRAEGRFRLWLF